MTDETEAGTARGSNEIVAAARDWAQVENDKDAELAKAKRWPTPSIGVAAAGIGIGSAALAAALLYARSGQKHKR